MVVAAIEAKFYRSFISGLGLASDPLFADFQQWDQKKWPQQKAAVADRFAAESRTHWTEVFSDLDACVSPVLTYAESAEQVDLTARGANRPIGDQVFPAPAPRFLKTPSSASRSEPADDLAAYLSSIGVSEASLDAWRESLPA
jgi:alpha-methylacyl-CoA racemase